jgi:hypothetical protein
MALAVCLLFDSRTERRVLALWQALEELGVPTLLTHTHRRHVPHLSYAVLRRYDIEAVLAEVKALRAQPLLEVHFDAVAWFRRGRGALVPAVSADLVSRQAAVVEATARAGAELHRHYEVGHWIPHCSLATRARRDQAGDIAGAAYDVLPLTATVEQAALIDSSTGRRWPLDHLV